jgi:hypothetical protein
MQQQQLSVLSFASKSPSEPGLGPPPGPPPPGYAWVPLFAPGQAPTWSVQSIGAAPGPQSMSTQSAHLNLDSIIGGVSNQLVDFSSVPPNLSASLPHSELLRVISLPLGQELTYNKILIRAERCGDVLKLQIWVDTDNSSTGEKIYKTINKRWVRLAMLIRNEPVVLLVDCGYVRGKLAFYAKEESCPCCCRWGEKHASMFRDRIRSNRWNPLSADVEGMWISNWLHKVSFGLYNPSSRELSWNVRPSGCQSWCMCCTLSVYVPIIPFMIISCINCGSLPVEERDTWTSFSLDKITVKAADCMDGISQ